MANLIEKPTEGFQTPYQFLLSKVADRVLSKADSEGVTPETLYERWESITETEVSIEVPKYMQNAKGNKYWKTFISCPERSIGEFPVRFHTFSLKEYLESVITDGSFKPYNLGKQPKKEGFYYSKNTDQIFLVVKADYRFCDGIMFSGIEFKTAMFLIAENGQSLVIEDPLVSGEIQIMYIN